MGLRKRIFAWRSGQDKSQQDPRQIFPQQSTRPASANAAGPYAYPSNVAARVSTISLGQVEEVDVGKTLPSFRGVHDNDRPGSADSFRSGGSGRPRAQRPKREPRRPPVSFRKPSILSLNQLASSQEQPVLYRETMSDTGSVRQIRESGSMNSLQKRQSTDLLDAAEQFRPLDFRSRVEAAGARDYGEDVADRNIARSTPMSTPDLYSQYSSTERSTSAQSGGPHLRCQSCTGSVSTLDNQHGPAFGEDSPSVIFGEPVSFSRKNKMRLSLNTYKPSGITSPTLHTPRSAVTTPGHRGGPISQDSEFPNVDSPLLEPVEWSRKYHMSPTGSNFSIPRSLKGTRHPLPEPNEPHPEPVEKVIDLAYDPEVNDNATIDRLSQRRSVAIGVVSITTPTNSSQETYRSSMASSSSISSRNTFMDFQPLGYPRGHASSSMDSKGFGEIDEVAGQLEISPSTRCKMHSKPSSSEDSQICQRKSSLHGVPSGFTDLFKIDEQTVPECSGSPHDWVLVTPSNMSTCSSSNGLLSNASGCGRPSSRHTKAKSTGSSSRPRSSQSHMSTSLGQGAGDASAWSPTTPQSTGFNIDDYISSDDDSLTTKRPCGEGEEELLFKDGYGATGAALPGLLASTIESCPPPIPRYRKNQAELPEIRQNGEVSEDDSGAAVAPNIEHARFGEPRDSPSVPSRRLSHTRSSPDHDLFSTFGRRATTRPRASNNRTPSWVPSDDWARPAQTKRVTTISNIQNGLYDVEEVKARYRGQTRLSALGMPSGMLSGQPLDSTVPMVNTLRRAISNSSSISSNSNSNSNSNKSNSKVLQSAPSPIKEVAPALAARLRREAKARDRENEAQAIQRKRLERTLGRTGAEMSAWARAPLAEAERGRARTRAEEGNGVIVG